MKYFLINLAELHYEFGLIGYDEYNERIGVALWLEDELPHDVKDPRTEDNKIDEESKNVKEEKEFNIELNTSENNKPDWLHFLFNGIWVFTKADRDPYPSIPHGHYRNQNNKWPKLNPYTGRVFSSKHQEDKRQRLSKIQMKNLWTDEKFKSFCREMIVWYRECNPHHEFKVRRPLRFPRW